jgi:hypothetical protein
MATIGRLPRSRVEEAEYCVAVRGQSGLSTELIRLRDWVPKDSCYATAPSMRAFRGFDKRSDLVGVRQRVDRRARSGQLGLLGKAGLILVPLPDWNYEK